MKETSKATKRRLQEAYSLNPAVSWGIIFRGVGLDVGAGDDPLDWQSFDMEMPCYPVPFDLRDGAGDDLAKFFPGKELFDFVHGSQVLEHALDPVVMLNSWIKLLKRGGHIVATVPDWGLYEHYIWPSKWNSGHRTAWTLASGTLMPHVLLPNWLVQFGCEILLCRLVDTNYNYDLGPEVDQTLDPEKGVECFIEFVLRKP